MKSIHVAAAAIQNQEDQILLSRRHPDSHQGDLWEFPGGKLEMDESVEEALYREMDEELDIQITEHRPLIRIRHDYQDRRVLLDVHLVTNWQGEPRGVENQPLRWVAARDLEQYAMPAADIPIIRALQLPSVYLITPPEVTDSRLFLKHIQGALNQGVKLLQFRVFGLDRDKHRALAQATLELCHDMGASMLINKDVQLARDIGADGVHLNRRQLKSLDCRPLPESKLMAASCHSLEELRLAQQLGADFAVLSPVLATQSHPDADLLGWDGFANAVDQAKLPVYALGGMQMNSRTKAWQAGAQGISGIRMYFPGDISITL